MCLEGNRLEFFGVPFLEEGLWFHRMNGMQIQYINDPLLLLVTLSSVLIFDSLFQSIHVPRLDEMEKLTRIQINVTFLSILALV